MSRPPQPLDAERELRLLTAAATAFTESGYELASLNQIITDAGWAKSSFYHYFPDKRRLHDHVVLTLRARVADELDLPNLDLLTQDTFWPAMTELATSFARAGAGHPETQLLERMVHHPPAARGPDGQLTLLRSDVSRWLAEAAATGLRLGELRTDLPADLLAELAFALMEVLNRWTLENPTPDDSDPALAITVVRDTLARVPTRAIPR